MVVNIFPFVSIKHFVSQRRMKDKFNGILLGNHWDLAPSLQRAFAVDCLMGGHVYVVELDGKIIGDAMWFGPGQGLMQA